MIIPKKLKHIEKLMKKQKKSMKRILGKGDILLMILLEWL
jgi:hypothetical protein